MIPICYALKETFKKHYSFRIFKNDAIAALVVSLAALPLAMALSIAVGLPPEHGIYTAIVAGIITPLLGGSAFQISGPTAAFVIIISPIVAQYGLRGLIVAEILAGIFLVLLGISRIGVYIRYIPYPVITGFTAGIAMVIATSALNDFLGLGISNMPDNYFSKITQIFMHIPTLSWPEASIGIISLIVMYTSNRIFSKIPPQMAGILVGTLLAYIMQGQGIDIATIGDKFTFSNPDGSIGHGIPSFMPSIHLPNFEIGSLFAWPSFTEIKLLLVPALVITTLASLESLLSAMIADGMTNTKHDPHSELVGIGFGNIFAGLAAGIPATAAIARTATNIYNGAKTPFASAMHAAFIIIYILFLTPVISYIPMASLAALLVTIAHHMSHHRQFMRIIQIAPKSDTITLLICFGLTAFVDMIAGITAAVILSCFLLVKRIANLTHANLSHASTGHHHKTKHFKFPENVMVYHINGALFFATAEKATDLTELVMDYVTVLIIDMEDVPLIDMSGMVAMKSMILDMKAANKNIILCGNQEVTTKIWQKLSVSDRHNVKIADNLTQASTLINF